MNGDSLKTLATGWDNPVFLLALRHRLRSGDYLFLCGVPVAYAIAWVAVGSLACLVPEPLPWPAGKLLFVVALALYFIALVVQVTSRHDPLSTSFQNGTLAQLLATGLSPVTWLTGAVGTLAVDLAVVLAFHLPIFLHLGLVGDVGLGAILLGILVVSVAGLSLCLLGLAVARRPFAGLLLGAVLLGAYVLSVIALAAPGPGAAADQSPGWVRGVALAPLAPVLPVAELAAVPLPAGHPVKGGTPVTGREPLGLDLVPVFFACNGALWLLELLLILSGMRRSQLPVAVELGPPPGGAAAPAFLSRGAAAPERAPSLTAASQNLYLSYRLFQENQPATFLRHEERLCLTVETVFLAALLGFCLAALGPVLPTEGGAWHDLPLGAAVLIPALLCGTTLCLEHGSVRACVLPGGWRRVVAWSALFTGLKAVVILLGALVAARAFVGTEGARLSQERALFVGLVAAALVWSAACGALVGLRVRHCQVAIVRLFYAVLAWCVGPCIVAFGCFYLTPAPPGVLALANLSPAYLLWRVAGYPIHSVDRLVAGRTFSVSVDFAPGLFFVATAVMVVAMLGLAACTAWSRVRGPGRAATVALLLALTVLAWPAPASAASSLPPGPRAADAGTNAPPSLAHVEALRALLRLRVPVPPAGRAVVATGLYADSSGAGSECWLRTAPAFAVVALFFLAFAVTMAVLIVRQRRRPLDPRQLLCVVWTGSAVAAALLLVSLGLGRRSAGTEWRGVDVNVQTGDAGADRRFLVLAGFARRGGRETQPLPETQRVLWQVDTEVRSGRVQSLTALPGGRAPRSRVALFSRQFSVAVLPPAGAAGGDSGGVVLAADESQARVRLPAAARGQDEVHVFVRTSLGLWAELRPPAESAAPTADDAVRPVSTAIEPLGRLFCSVDLGLAPRADAFAVVVCADQGAQARARRAVETVAVTFLPLALLRERPVERTVQFRGACTVAGPGTGAQPGAAVALANAVGEVALALEGEPPPQPDETLAGAQLTVSGSWQAASAAAADLTATCQVAVRRPGRTEWQPLGVFTYAPVATLSPAALQAEWERWRTDEQTGGLVVTRTWDVPPDLCVGALEPGAAVVRLTQAGAGPAFVVTEVIVKLKLRRHEHD